jgi:tetratricopeptide (TPR) repeat protein
MRYVIYAICALSAVAVMLCVAVGLTRYIVPDASCQATDPHTQIIGCTAEINKSDVNSTLQDAYFRRGWAELRLNQPDLAIADETKALSFYPMFSSAFAVRGAAYGKKGQWQSDIADQNAAIALDSHYALGYSERGYAEAQSNLNAAALADFNTSLKLEPDSKIALVERGTIELRMGAFDQAVADSTRAITLDPKYIYAFRIRATAYEREHDYARAVADRAVLVAAFPKSEMYLNNLCWSRALGGDLQTALGECVKAISLNPKDPAVRDSLGFVYLKLKQFDAAIAAYSDALKLAPKAASSLYGRALAEQALGELPAAKADFAAAAAIDPAIAADFGT